MESTNSIVRKAAKEKIIFRAGFFSTGKNSRGDPPKDFLPENIFLRFAFTVKTEDVTAAGATSWTKWKRFADRSPAYRRFMAIGSVMLAAICAVSILSLMIPAAIHRPCD